VVIATLGLVTSYTDTVLANGTYTYNVNAFNSAGTSPSSSPATAIVSTAAAANLAPSTLGFGSVIQGQTSSALTTTVTSSGTANLILASSSAVTLSGANAADFGISATTCTNSLSLAPAATCTVSVTFTPSLASAEVASLVIVSNDPSSPDSVPLSGTGVGSVAITPTSLNFGNQYINKTSVAQTVTYQNNSGSTITFTSVALTTGTQFALTNTGTGSCTGTLTNGSSCSFTATFTPTSSGSKADTITITDSSSGSPRTVSVSGNGKKHGVLRVGAAISFPYGGADMIRTVLRPWKKDELRVGKI
jgi:hypothetical protein